MSTTVTYKGNQLVSFDSGTKTLETAGKYCEDDITVTSTGGDPYEKWKEYIASKDSWQYLFAYNSNNSFDEYIADLNLNNLYNNAITNLSYMFAWNRSLTELHNFKPIGATNMSYMFNLCQNLVEITGFDTSTVTDFRDIFNYCGKLKTVKTLDTSHSSYDLYFGNTYALTDIEFRPNRIRRNISFPVSAGLTLASLVSIANGLSEDVTDQYLTLPSSLSTSGGILDTTTGTYETIYEEYDNYDIFTADDEPVQGHTTLRQFITNVKGWGII